MKKYIILLIIVIALIGLLNKEENDEIRIRIIAESDKLSDQLDKLEVRDALVEIISDNQINNEEAIRENLSLINEQLKEKIAKQLYDKLTIEYTYVDFPAKSSEGKLVLAGTYKTLLIKIGSANGKNWWSVLYPDFFDFEYDENNEVEYRSYFYDLIKK